ncbi:SMI1 / KNR4 family [Roseibium sp. TrichSKD4]|uniref:SMI1/KNR4 family protein n=1 Tax=Roseibium sp. TrichSKD4 TaxID=744980 RepID=UPI0001E56D1B|nr:SMI1/KNR4 family protein [Roseibium sp. TrichSKD4]EFO30241.1 SMI1 / KNR4 family [Roseibium sp. TrichSKD4]
MVSIKRWSKEASASKIEEFQQKIGAELPADYVDFLATYNGASFPLDAGFEDEVNEASWPVMMLYHISNTEADLTDDKYTGRFMGWNVLNNTEEMRGQFHLPNGYLCIGRAHEHALIILEISSGALYYFVEQEIENVEDFKEKMVLMANSFSKYWGGLVDEYPIY